MFCYFLLHFHTQGSFFVIVYFQRRTAEQRMHAEILFYLNSCFIRSMNVFCYYLLHFHTQASFFVIVYFQQRTVEQRMHGEILFYLNSCLIRPMNVFFIIFCISYTRIEENTILYTCVCTLIYQLQRL